MKNVKDIQHEAIFPQSYKEEESFDGQIEEVDFLTYKGLFDNEMAEKHSYEGNVDKTFFLEKKKGQNNQN